MRIQGVLGKMLTFLTITMGAWLRLPAQIARPSDSPFDPPMRKQVVDLGPSEFHEPRFKVRNTLTCFYYPRFMVKQLDFRQKGAEWDAIVPVRGDSVPKCEQTRDEGEIRLEPWGYFSGVVGNLLFLDASDGMNGSMAFKVIEAESGKEVFQDTAKRRYKIKNNTLVWEGQRLQIERNPIGPPVLTYLRAYFADCPLPKGGAACWNKIRSATGLKQLAAPVCTQQFKEDPDDPSVVFYPVRVDLGPKPVAVQVSGPIHCEDQE